jgi:acyl carrier protein
VSAATGAIDLERLRSFLKERLAEYMVPASFVLMEEFPLTSSGKVDRRALPAPQATRQTATNYVPPFGETERRVAQIWEEILGIDRVGLEDRFFDIGGHSLLLVGLAAKLQESFGRPVSVMDLFQRPTVAEQARFLANEICAGTNLPDAQDRARKQKAFLSQRAKKSQPTNCG